LFARFYLSSSSFDSLIILIQLVPKQLVDILESTVEDTENSEREDDSDVDETYSDTNSDIE